MSSSRFTCSATFLMPRLVKMAKRQPKRFRALHNSRTPGVNCNLSMTLSTACAPAPLSKAALASFCFSLVSDGAAALGSRPTSLRTSSRMSHVTSSCDDRPKTTRDLPLGRFIADHQRRDISARNWDTNRCKPSTQSSESLRPAGQLMRNSILFTSPLTSFLLSLRCSTSRTTQLCSLSRVSTPSRSCKEISARETMESTATFSLPAMLARTWPASGK
mmetsp:Transcript_107326/g.308851  ORF Transcript_107326/g.308851 Transcript_107326/m.308851 type:complete len:218 (+) Transcript_107326:1743-2396(+)